MHVQEILHGHGSAAGLVKRESEFSATPAAQSAVLYTGPDPNGAPSVQLNDTKCQKNNHEMHRFE
jgi:hypothetical protein